MVAACGSFGELANSLGGRIDHTFGTIWTSFALDFPLTQREQHANRAVARPPPQKQPSIEGHASLPSVPVAGERANPIVVSHSSRSKETHNVGKGSSYPVRERVARRRYRRAHAALAQFGPPPGPPPALAGPPPGLGAGGPPPGLAGGPPPRWSSGRTCRRLSPRGAVGAPPRDVAGGPPRLNGAGGLQGPDRGGQASFRGIEGRGAAYSANSYARNSYHSYGYGRGYRYGPYAAAAAYAYGRSYASSDDGCYYVSTYRRYGTRRVLVCDGD